MDNLQSDTNLEIMDKDKSAKNIVQYLTFYIGNEIYGIAVEQIKEVIEYNYVFAIPRTPDYIRGIINLRGEILPVIDLSYLFYNLKSEVRISTSIVFIECKAGDEIIVVGGVVDTVESVTDILEENIEPNPAFGEKIRPDYINGIGKADGRFIILLNINAVLNIEELSRFKSEKITH